MVTKQFYIRHICNGGVNFTLSFDEYKTTNMQLSASYYGYPSATLEFNGLSSEDLKGIAATMLNVAEMMDNYEIEV